MRYQEQHEAFKRLAIQQGICRLDELNQALPFGCTVPQPKVDRWLNRLLELPTEFSSQRRYVNRFKLGADPEFVFVKAGMRMNAHQLSLQQGLAFGMDNNGRLTEIRPHPSRSALNVTASILTTLRWLAILHPETLGFDWQAGAFLFGDGLGGHVHFGRKRPNRDAEIKALDAVDEELIQVKAYPVLEILRRRQGDEHHQYYGLPGDYRKQQHGYEYRTFPSWLDSPELAFLTITLAKLAVYNPSLTHGYAPLKNLSQNIQRIKNLLSYYKDLDDDARLAFMMVSRRFPVHVGGDFKKRWAIEGAAPGTAPTIQFIPASIKPTVEDIREVFDHLSGDRPLVNKVPTPSWTPTNPPEGYLMAIQRATTYGAKGLGELIWDLCLHRTMKFGFVNAKGGPDNGVFFTIPRSLANILPADWRKFTRNRVNVHDSSDDPYIYSTEKTRTPENFAECRKLLLETVFPFWKIGDVKPDSILQWRSSLRPKEFKPRYAGAMLMGDIDFLFKSQGIR